MNLKSYVRTAYTAVAGEDPLEPIDDRPGTIRFAVDPKTGGILALALALLCGLVVAWTASRPATVHAVPGQPVAQQEASASGRSPSQPPVAGPPVPGQPSVGSPEATVAPTAEVIVYVSGEVADPGIVHLPEGSRVVDAVEKAGGMSGDADANALNLARLLVDGEHILVPRPGQPVQVEEAADTPVSLSTASAQELEELPGVGPSLAEKIIKHREDNGPFSSVEDLLDVKGIGEAKLAEIAEHAVP